MSEFTLAYLCVQAVCSCSDGFTGSNCSMVPGAAPNISSAGLPTRNGLLTIVQGQLLR